MNKGLFQKLSQLGLSEEEIADFRGYLQTKKNEVDKARKEMIANKAKSLGIPQYRIDEGFAISPDADESAVSEYLKKVSDHIKMQGLPGGGGSPLRNDVDPLKADADRIARAIVG